MDRRSDVVVASQVASRRSEEATCWLRTSGTNVWLLSGGGAGVGGRGRADEATWRLSVGRSKIAPYQLMELQCGG